MLNEHPMISHMSEGPLDTKARASHLQIEGKLLLSKGSSMERTQDTSTVSISLITIDHHFSPTIAMTVNIQNIQKA